MRKSTRKCRKCGRKLSPNRSVPVCPRCVAEAKDERSASEPDWLPAAEQRRRMDARS